MKYKILHISPHLGGGVGRVLVNYLIKVNSSQEYKHSICCLDSINNNAKTCLDNENIIYTEDIAKEQLQLLCKISDADIIIIHWWNHPLLYEFMIKNELPPSRVIIWSHVSGKEVPQIFSHKLFDYSVKFIFTTPISYLTDQVKTYKNQNKLSHIWSTGGLNHIKNIKKKVHLEFNIGYIGTLDFSKMYPNFIELCSKINIPNVKFIICGEGCDKEALISQATNLGISDKFEFTGYIEDITKYLCIFDIFGYPLNKNHYGTCDQVLAEAMGSGIIPIVFNNNMEQYMVHNMYSGLVVETEEQYIESIMMLYSNFQFKSLIETNTKKEAKLKFEIDTMIDDWNKIFKTIIKIPKTSKIWRGKYKGINTKAYQIFLESIDKYAEIFESKNNSMIKDLLNSTYSWKSMTKGTVNHYASFFEDEKLKLWSKIT